MSSRSSGRVRLTTEQAREAWEAAAAAANARGAAIVLSHTVFAADALFRCVRLQLVQSRKCQWVACEIEGRRSRAIS